MYRCTSVKGFSVKSVSYFSVINMTLHDATLRMDTLWCTEHYIHTRSLPIVISLCITCSRTPEGKISWPCAGLKSSPAVAVISNVLYSTDATPVTSRPRRTATTLERGRRMRKERMWVSVHVIVCTTLITPLRAHSRVGFLRTTLNVILTYLPSSLRRSPSPRTTVT